MSDISRGSLSESPAKLDEETERTISELLVRQNHYWQCDCSHAKCEHQKFRDAGVNALRTRIRELVEEARGADNQTCPCGNRIIRDGVVVMAHWRGRVCQECEATMFEKYSDRVAYQHENDPDEPAFPR